MINLITQPISRRISWQHVFAVAAVLLVASLAFEATSSSAAGNTVTTAVKKKLKRKALPVVTGFGSEKAVVRGQLTIKGKNFVKGAGKMVVIFRRDGGKSVAIRATAKSTTALIMVIPDSLQAHMQTNGKDFVETVFRVRLVTKAGLSKSWTPKDKSITIAPLIAIGVVVGDDCDQDGLLNPVDLDDDNDSVPDLQEARHATEPCSSDTDKDGLTDYYEIRVSIEYNGREVPPYPGATAYTNPIFADGEADHDGDTMNGIAEFDAWQYTKRMDRFYSEAKQDSDGDGIPDNAEDEDGDLLPNGFELEVMGGGKYPTHWLKPDTDGDGLCDGLDDQDFDGIVVLPAQGDCTAVVPNNAPDGTDADPGHIDGDDNIYSNYMEGVPFFKDSGTAVFDPCIPSNTSPYCPQDKRGNDPWP